MYRGPEPVAGGRHEEETWGPISPGSDPGRGGDRKRGWAEAGVLGSRAGNAETPSAGSGGEATPGHAPGSGSPRGPAALTPPGGEALPEAALPARRAPPSPRRASPSLHCVVRFTSPGSRLLGGPANPAARPLSLSRPRGPPPSPAQPLPFHPLTGAAAPPPRGPVNQFTAPLGYWLRPQWKSDRRSDQSTASSCGGPWLQFF